MNVIPETHTKFDIYVFIKIHQSCINTWSFLCSIVLGEWEVVCFVDIGRIVDYHCLNQKHPISLIGRHEH